jgi:hypothetical protein
MFVIRPILVAMMAVGAAALTISTAVPAADAPAVTAKVPVAQSAPQLPSLTVAQIVDKHVVARGGAQAWKAVQTLQLTGKIEAGRADNIARADKMVKVGKKLGGKASSADIQAANADLASSKPVELPFTLDLQRPNRMRLEIAFDGKTAVQVYDGTNGWKYRPFLNRSDAEPFTAEEASAEASRGELDGLLINYAAKGSKVELEGTDLVEGQPAYRLKVTPRTGDARHIWIDGKTFLDVKVEGFPKRMDGKMRPVYVYQRDFRPVPGGVILPFVLETAVDGYADTHKVRIEVGAVNPKFENALFTKPGA